MEAGLGCCEFVAALVVKVPRVPLDPLPPYDVLFGELVKFFPEIRVGKRIGFRLSPPGPSVHTPLVTPRCDAFQKVSAISEQQYLTGLQEGLEALDGSPKLSCCLSCPERHQRTPWRLVCSAECKPNHQGLDCQCKHRR